MQSAGKTRVQLLTGDAEFEQLVRSTFDAGGGRIELVAAGALGADSVDALDASATVAVIDIDASNPDILDVLQQIMTRPGRQPPVVAVLQEFNQDVVRRLLQMRVADLLVRPVSPVELVRTCARVAQSAGETDSREADIVTLLPAVGGAGVTTLAIQSALILLENSKRAKSTCLVDLDFQHGACTDYLDIEPRLDLKEIEPRPDRLDRQLLEIMTTYHPSGLAVIAAPNRPAEMRTFDPDMVTHLLDLVSSHFDHVVIDMPRTWFSWTDNVLLGSNRVFIVSEMTVPAIKHARKLVSAIGERLGDGPNPRVIVNRFEQFMFGAGLKKSDLDQALGTALAGLVPNDYRTVREAIDRGVPLSEVKANNKIVQALRPLITPPKAADEAGRSKLSLSRLKLSWSK
ncbi:MAG: AAA family ATPase [Xanthobacteraceae bacterium]